eukprot:SAG25_NODE_527_length_7183_cov_5.308018_8_plen_84_part_00
MRHGAGCCCHKKVRHGPPPFALSFCCGAAAGAAVDWVSPPGHQSLHALESAGMRASEQRIETPMHEKWGRVRLQQQEAVRQCE